MSHSHDGSVPVSARTRRAVIAILIPAAMATLIGLILLWPSGKDHSIQGGQSKQAEGEVTQVIEQSCPDATDEEQAAGVGAGPCGTATVKVTDGEGAGKTVTVELPQGPGAPVLRAGEQVVLALLDTPGETSTAANAGTRYTVIDHQRGRPLLLLLGLVALIVIAIGRLRGLAALAGLAVSFAVLLLFVLPAILDGSSPLLVAVVGSATIMFVVLYLTHGLSVHTSVAILGTLASLVLTGLLGAAFTSLTKLSGLADEQSVFLKTSFGSIDARGLLLAGIIIGALGVLDDVTVTQTAAVAELARTSESRLELYRSAIRVGRAHAASVVNTIVLAYAGASLPLLLLVAVSDQSTTDILTGQLVAGEIVRSAVGTIGLVAAVPITTALAVLVAEPGRDPLDDGDGYLDDEPDPGPEQHGRHGMPSADQPSGPAPPQWQEPPPRWQEPQQPYRPSPGGGYGGGPSLDRPAQGYDPRT